MAHQLAVVAVVGGIGGVDHLRGLVVQTGQLRELAGRQLIRQRVAVHGLDVHKAHGVVHLIILLQLRQQGGLLVVVAGGDHQGQHVAGGEGVLDHLLGDLVIILDGRGQQAVPVGEGAAGGQEEAHGDQQGEDHGHHVPRGVVEIAHEGYLGHEAAVLRPVDEGAEQHQKARHHHEGGQQREQDGFDEAQGHIGAQLELHEQHGHQTADGGQAAGADLGDGFAQGDDDGLPQVQQPVFLLEAVAEDDGVVDRQRQLQNTGDGVGHEGDLAHQEVGALIQHQRHHEGQNQHRHLAVGLGGEGQHDDNDDGHVDHNDADLVLNGLLLGIAQIRGDVEVIAAEGCLHRIQRRQAGVVILVVGEGDGEQSGHVVVVVGGLVVGQALDTLDVPELVSQLLSLGRCDVGHHYLRRAVGDELLVHDGQRLLGLRVVRQVEGQVILHLDPVTGKGGENEADDGDEKDQIPLIHDERGQLFHERGAVCVGLAHDLCIPSSAAVRSFSIAASGRICTTSPSVHSSRRQMRTSTSSDTGSFFDSLASVLELMPTLRANSVLDQPLSMSSLNRLL